MPTDSEILAVVSEAFRDCPRPEHFTNYTHCEECEDHDRLLLSRDLESLGIEDVGSEAWDPLCFTSAEGFCYFMPALVRLALAEPSATYGWYLPHLLFHLTYEGGQNRHVLHCNARQKKAVESFLLHVAASRDPLVVDYQCGVELRSAIKLWSPE